MCPLASAEPGTEITLAQRGKIFTGDGHADAVRSPPLSPQGSRLMTVYYTKEHEWVRVEGDSATVGITDFAQGQLGDIVFVEVPEAGRHGEPRAARRRWSNRSRRRPTSMRRSAAR